MSEQTMTFSQEELQEATAQEREAKHQGELDALFQRNVLLRAMSNRLMKENEELKRALEDPAPEQDQV